MSQPRPQVRPTPPTSGPLAPDVAHQIAIEVPTQRTMPLDGGAVGGGPGAARVAEPDTRSPLAPATAAPATAAPPMLPVVLPARLTSLRRRLALVTAVAAVIAVTTAGLTVAHEQQAAEQAAMDARAAVAAAQAEQYAAERQLLREQINAASWAQTLAKQAAAATAGGVVLESARAALAGSPQAGEDVRAALQAALDAATAVVTATPSRSVMTIDAAVATVSAPVQAVVASQAAWQVAEDARLAAERAAAEAAAAAKAAAARAPRTATTRKATTSTSSAASGASAPAPAEAAASNVPEFSAGELGGAINAFRASQGLGALSISRSGTLVAHAGAMALAGDIWHGGSDKIVGYVQPASASGLVDAWANSAGHRAWMLKTTVSSMQVGAVVLDGRLYGAVNFS
ncbi:CAP domain-containing protein [Pengzhenrongella frigida]|uniref:CAP domain-containing protein n=1 Tax=Pengzhenrongella frigida TaxID=1259133 RepID=UPI0013EDCFFD|nr:CAP domain-containing protein [Cellulomonas sp. HLT2-17]